MRVALITDTVVPQVNGVSTVLQRMATALDLAGHRVGIVAPRYPDYPSREPLHRLRVPSVLFPPYPDIRLSAPYPGQIDRFLDCLRPEVVQIGRAHV